MRLLLDTCVWGGGVEILSATGHDVVWAGDWAQDPGDEEILNIAEQEGRILVTLDKDFGELAIVRGTKHRGIVRLVNISATMQAPICLHVIALHGPELGKGAIVTAEPGRLRVRPPE